MNPRKREISVVVAIAAAFAVVGAASSASDPAVACAVAKHKAAVKYFSGAVKCWDKSLAKGTDFDPTCVTSAAGKLTAAFMKADTKGGCVTTNDAGPVTESVNEMVGTVLATMPWVTTTTTTLPPFGCCESSVQNLCTYVPASVCISSGGTPGATYDLCDGITGACGPDNPSPGDCCLLPSGACVGGPDPGGSGCTLAGGVHSPNKLCSPFNNGCF
jgi:hypothetical protein